MALETTIRAKTTLQVSGEVSGLIRGHYEKVKTAKKEGKPVVWAFGLIPREIFNAMDVPVIMLEHLPGMLAAKQLSGKYCQVAEEKGFARDLCAYHTCFLGCALSDELDPYTEKRFAAPDLIVASNFPCNSESKSFLYLAEHFNCPCYFVDAPINSWEGGVKDYAVEYHAANLKGLINFLEKHGYQLNNDKLAESVELSRQLLVLWNELVECRKVIPTPMGAVDAYVSLFPLFQLPGTRTAVDFYQRLLDEVKQRVKSKAGVIDEEKFRLLWLGIP
ncbi:MAG: 2-hydroxyacyl-CoA dehydratase family protein, partial [Desulfatirhabdiaceae bacterium]